MIQQSDNLASPVPESEVWAAARQVYVTTETAASEIALQFGFSESSVLRRMEAEGWTAQRMLFLDGVAVEARSRFGRELERMAQEELIPAMRDHSKLCRNIRQAMREELLRGGVTIQGGGDEGASVLGKSAFSRETLELLERETRMLALIVSGGRTLPESSTGGDGPQLFNEGGSDSDASKVIEIV